MEDRVMASPFAISIFAMAGAMNVAVGVAKLFIGLWGFTIGWCLISTVWFYLAFRLSRYPVVSFEHSEIVILSRPAFPTKRISIQEINEVKVGYFDAKILLKNGKTIGLPVSFMKKVDKENVLKKIRALIDDLNQTEPGHGP